MIVKVIRKQPSTFSSIALPSLIELETARSWLTSPRILILTDRSLKREYCFSLFTQQQATGTSYILQWREEASSNNAVADNFKMPVVGFVSIADVRNIVTTDTQLAFSLVLRDDSTRVLKNSGGRHSVTIVCSSELDFQRYRTYLNLLCVSLQHQQ